MKPDDHAQLSALDLAVKAVNSGVMPRPTEGAWLADRIAHIRDRCSRVGMHVERVAVDDLIMALRTGRKPPSSDKAALLAKLAKVRARLVQTIDNKQQAAPHEQRAQAMREHLGEATRPNGKGR